jgi:hypothetical protein
MTNKNDRRQQTTDQAEPKPDTDGRWIDVTEPGRLAEVLGHGEDLGDVLRQIAGGGRLASGARRLRG